MSVMTIKVNRPSCLIPWLTAFILQKVHPQSLFNLDRVAAQVSCARVLKKTGQCHAVVLLFCYHRGRDHEKAWKTGWSTPGSPGSKKAVRPAASALRTRSFTTAESARGSAS